MSVNPSATNSVSETSVKPFLNRIGSIQWQNANGERVITLFSELPGEEQEKIRRMIQVFLSSRPFLTHLQNHRGIYNIVYREGEKRIIIAGKTFELQESNEADPEKEKPSEDLLVRVQGSSEGVAITVDSLSVVRNAISAIATSALANPHSIVSFAVEGVGTIGGIAATVGGIIMISKGIQKMMNAKEKEEWDLGMLQTASGTGYLSFGLSSIMYRVSSCFESATGISQGFLTFGLNPALFFMNAGFALWGLYRIAIAGSFRSELNQAIEKGGSRGGIDFLYENLFLNSEEQAQMEQITDSDKKAKETKKILERKKAHLERRIGETAVKEISSQIEEVKRRFDDEGVLDGANLEKALSLIDKALQGNYQELVKSALFVTLAILSIVSITALGPTGTFAFFVALGILWLINDCTMAADFTTEKLWGLHQRILGLIVVSIDGQDQEFMEYLYFLDPKLKEASPQAQALAYVEAFTDMNDEFYRLYRKIREKNDAELFDPYLQILREIRQAAIQAELNTPEACADHLFSAAPLFLNWMSKEWPKDEVHERVRDALIPFCTDKDQAPNGANLKRAVLRMLEVHFDGAAPPENEDSDTIEVDACPKSFDRLSGSSPL